MKRLFDLSIATIAFILLCPVMFVVAVLVRLFLGNEVLYCQERPGRFGKPFKIYKFRTMLNAVDGNGNNLPDHMRMSKFGCFLRSSSLDELPELWNVLKGDMSLVGPRPLLMEYLSLYSTKQARRHEVRPGITGWAQINGRNAISWEEKFKLDVWYVDNQTLWLDMKILCLTVKKVFIREGISQEGQATIEKFQGTVQ